MESRKRAVSLCDNMSDFVDVTRFPLVGDEVEVLAGLGPQRIEGDKVGVAGKGVRLPLHVFDDGCHSLPSIGTFGNNGASVCICSPCILGLGLSVFGGGLGVLGVNGDMQPLLSTVGAARGDVFECSFCVSSFR